MSSHAEIAHHVLGLAPADFETFRLKSVLPQLKLPLTPVLVSSTSTTSSAKSIHHRILSYGPPWAHYLGEYQDRLLGGPQGLLGLCHTAPDGVERKDCGGEVLG
jgi:hypothetical protein